MFNYIPQIYVAGVGNPLCAHMRALPLSYYHVFGRYVVPTLLAPTFRRNWCWFRLGVTLCHDVLRCCHALATPEARYFPVMTRDSGKFSYVVLRHVPLPPRCSLAAATLLPRVRGFWSRFVGVCSLTYCNGNFRVTIVSKPFNVIL